MASPMSRVNSLVSADIGNYLTNKETWSSILFNVKSYGAKGDGTTDDTTAIQSAINAAQTNGGGIVFFPEGIFKFSGISFPDSGIQIILKGSGNRNSILNYYGSNTAIDAIGTTSSRVYFYLRDLAIFNKSSGAFGIEAEWNAVHSGMRNVQIEGFLTSQMRINNSWQCSFESVLFNGTSYLSGGSPTSTHGVHIGSNTTTLRFFDCTMDNSTFGALVEAGNSHQFLECVFQNDDNAGVYITNATTSGGGVHSVESCYFERGTASATAWGVKIAGTVTYQIATCYITNCSFNDMPYQLYLGYAPQTVVVANNFNSTATRAVEIHTGSSRCMFVANNNGHATPIYNPDSVAITAIEMEKMIMGSTSGNQLVPGVDINMNLKNIANIFRGQITGHMLFGQASSASIGLPGANTYSLFNDSADGFLKTKDNSGNLQQLLRKSVAVPTTSASAGNIGDFAFDASYLYYCYASNTWLRIAGSAF